MKFDAAVAPLVGFHLTIYMLLQTTSLAIATQDQHFYTGRTREIPEGNMVIWKPWSEKRPPSRTTNTNFRVPAVDSKEEDEQDYVRTIRSMMSSQDHIDHMLGLQGAIRDLIQSQKHSSQEMRKRRIPTAEDDMNERANQNTKSGNHHSHPEPLDPATLTEYLPRIPKQQVQIIPEYLPKLLKRSTLSVPDFPRNPFITNEPGYKSYHSPRVPRYVSPSLLRNRYRLPKKSSYRNPEPRNVQPPLEDRYDVPEDYMVYRYKKRNANREMFKKSPEDYYNSWIMNNLG